MDAKHLSELMVAEMEMNFLYDIENSNSIYAGEFVKRYLDSILIATRYEVSEIKLPHRFLSIFIDTAATYKRFRNHDIKLSDSLSGSWGYILYKGKKLIPV